MSLRLEKQLKTLLKLSIIISCLTSNFTFDLYVLYPMVALGSTIQLLQCMNLLSKFLQFVSTSRRATVSGSCRSMNSLAIVPCIVSSMAFFTVRLSNVHHAVSERISHKFNASDIKFRLQAVETSTEY
jgi:hypothetical protein